MSFFRKKAEKHTADKKKNVTLETFDDRRILPDVPDPTGQRTSFDRRGVVDDPNDVDAVMKKRKSGIRYKSKFPVTVDFRDQDGKAHSVRGESRDISETGILVRLEKEDAEQLKEARSFGDLSENAEYDEAKNEQGKLYSRIAELEEIIKHAVVVTGDSYAADEVSPGCRFIVKDLEEDEEEEYHFVGSQEADPMDGKISDESPFGKAMLGKKVGDVVEVEAPIGIVKYEILKIEK